jgi:putative glutamine amidotransferase
MLRPIIVVSGPDRGGLMAWLFTWWAVWLWGGHALRATPRRGAPQGRFDGLILGGGADVHPSRYDDAEPPPPPLEVQLRRTPSRSKLRTVVGYLLAPFLYVLRRLFSSAHPGLDPARDELETALLKRALADGAPILGICRGAQLINVQLGGTLHRGLETFYVEEPNPWSVLPRKLVRLDAGSVLAQTVRRSSMRVNSLHRQAVDRLGEGLRAVAVERNGVVQAVELAMPGFCVGVQWHPEYLPQRPEQRRIFRALVRKAFRHAKRVALTARGWR